MPRTPMRLTSCRALNGVSGLLPPQVAAQVSAREKVRRTKSLCWRKVSGELHPDHGATAEHHGGRQYAGLLLAHQDHLDVLALVQALALGKLEAHALCEKSTVVQSMVVPSAVCT